MVFLFDKTRREGEEKRKKLELKCLLRQTHGVRENFQFNQIIIDDVTNIFCECGSSFIIKKINFIFKRPINFALECVEFTVWTGSKGKIRLFEGHTSDTITFPHVHDKITLESTLFQEIWFFILYNENCI